MFFFMHKYIKMLYNTLFNCEFPFSPCILEQRVVCSLEFAIDKPDK